MYNDLDEKKESKPKFQFLRNIFRKRTKRLMTDIDRLFSKIMWMDIALSICLTLVGLIFLVYPDVSVTVIGIIFGLLITILGGVLIYTYLKRREIPLFKFNLIYGILGVILGILTIISPFTFTQVITIFIGIWILYMAVIKIDFAVRLKLLEERSWLFLLVSALLEIFMSILIFINPFSNLIITEIAGAYFVLCGILNCTDAVLTKNRAIDFLENL
uniref:HdeD family acid-resistance protein n=1 Tax=Candidatus Ventrenecus sp. TaxID=3085654 RepID=UPI003FEFFA7A